MFVNAVLPKGSRSQAPSVGVHPCITLNLLMTLWADGEIPQNSLDYLPIPSHNSGESLPIPSKD